VIDAGPAFANADREEDPNWLRFLHSASTSCARSCTADIERVSAVAVGQRGLCWEEPFDYIFRDALRRRPGPASMVASASKPGFAVLG